MVMQHLRHIIAQAGAVALAVLAGCGEFEVRSIVLDLRMLSLVVTPPEVLVPLDEGVDFMDLPPIDVEVCALIADPRDSRELEYRMTACWPNDVTLRCDDPARAEVLLTGTPGSPFSRVPDPEEAGEPVRVCATMSSNAVLPVLILDQIDLQGSYEDVAAQVLANGGNLDVQIEVAVRGVGQSQEDLQYGSKRMRYAVPLCEVRLANRNPGIAELQASVNGAEAAPMPVGRCADQAAPLVVSPGDEVEIEPVEVELEHVEVQPSPPADARTASGSREKYCVPTFGSETRYFVENLVYTWYATHGAWELDQTGGPRDVAGNEPEYDSTWTAPRNPDVIGDGIDVPIWVVQRDERGGQSWVETCVRVNP
jgi:hypothetical protein